MKDLESFLELTNHVDAIKRREKTRKAALNMVDLIDEILNYVCNSVPSGLSGMYFSLRSNQYLRSSSVEDVVKQEFPEKIGTFSSKFAKERQVFNESLHVVILEGVDSLGEQCRYDRSRLGKLMRASFLRESEGIGISREVETSPQCALPVW